MSSKNKENKFFWTVLIVAVSFYVGVAWGKRVNEPAIAPAEEISSFIKNLSSPGNIFKSANEESASSVDFDIFWDVWRKVDRKFVDTGKLDAQKRVYGAVEGMIRSLDDPYSGFMDPEETKDFNSDMEGSFEGIGAELGIREGFLTVIAPIEGMPAQAAGLRSGDKIIKINDEITADITIDEAVKKIRGKKGTQVILTVMRNQQETKEIAIIRGKIEIKSVLYERKENGGIGYIKIKKFVEDTSKEFDKAVAMAVADNSRGLIVDVRNNPGGFLHIAVNIISEFIPRGKVVLVEKGRSGKERIYKARGGDSLSHVPVVVLINEGSASASEILAGALRDNKKVKLIGKKTYGKGSVQQLDYLKDGSSLRITTAKWFTPSMESIHEVGLEPDIEVDMTEKDWEENKDPQFERALEELKKVIR